VADHYRALISESTDIVQPVAEYTQGQRRIHHTVFPNILLFKSKTPSELLGDKYKIIYHAGKVTEPND
jgi:hypothetical protein